MTNTRQKAFDDQDCHTSLLSQGGASDLQAHSLYKTWTVFCFVTLKLLMQFLHVKINKRKMAKQHSNSPLNHNLLHFFTQNITSAYPGSFQQALAAHL